MLARYLDRHPLVHSVGELPPALAEPLLDLLIDLRAQRISNVVFWKRWEALPAEEPGQLDELREFLASWLHWRERGMQPGGNGHWPTERPQRTERRITLNRIIERLQRAYRPGEVTAAPSPEGRGSEAAPGDAPHLAAPGMPRP